MDIAVKISLLASGLFLLNGMLTGIWKYRKIASSPERRAPVYVDIAHRSSFMYSFASVVIAKLIESSPFPVAWQLVAVAFPLVYFAITVIGYMREGYLDRTENIFAEKSVALTIFMYSLIVAEIGGLMAILGGFIFVNFYSN